MSGFAQEHDAEPIRGLPGPLPAGETILWQGAPDWRVLARTALKAHWVAAYFGALAIWTVGSHAVEGMPAMQAVVSGIPTLLAGVAAVGLILLYAWAVGRTTVYTLTNRRFVLRHGIALSKCFNVPYGVVASAGVKVDARGFGDIPMGLAGDAKIAFPHLWPHVRPWSIVSPQPMMLALPDAASVAERLSLQLQLASTAADRPFVAEPVRTRPQSGLKPASGQPAAA